MINSRFKKPAVPAFVSAMLVLLLTAPITTKLYAAGAGSGEIPTPPWSTFEALRFGIPIPDGAPVSTQERAYTSPIWYTP